MNTFDDLYLHLTEKVKVKPPVFQAITDLMPSSFIISEDVSSWMPYPCFLHPTLFCLIPMVIIKTDRYYGMTHVISWTEDRLI